MAEKMSDMDMSNKRKYDWRQWSDGGTWLLVRGVDYFVSRESMRSAAQAHARKIGARVVTRSAHERNGMYVQFIRPIAPEPKRLTKPKPKRKQP